MTIELTKEELTIIILGMTSGQFPINRQVQAFELVLKLRDMLREAD